MIYIKEDLKFKELKLDNNSDIWEVQFVEIFTEHIHLKIIIIGNIYRPPRDINANYQQFIDEFTPTLDILAKYKCDVIIAGDFNIDLLKVHEKPLFSEYLDTITANAFFPQITLPTRFSDRRGTLIEFFLYKWSQRIPTITAGILISNISDHLPYFISINDINIKTQSVPKTIQITQRGDDNIRKLKTELSIANICSKINTDPHANPNENYNIVNQILADLMYKYLPTKTVKFNKKKHKRTQWITTGLIKSIAFRDKLYKQLKQTDASHVQHEIIKINLKTYNTILKNSIRSAKRKYYYERFDKSKNNIKNTWRYINEIMNRNTKNNFPDVFVNNGKLINDKDLIANEFNAYFSNIGKQLASSMDNNNNNNNANISFKDFMGNPS